MYPRPVRDTDIAIIGGGLSGLRLASLLTDAGKDWRLLEARPRLGGRALSVAGGGSEIARYDLGPGWVWPGDRRVAALAAARGLRLFPQFASGRLAFESANGDVRRDLDMALMGGAFRIEGGAARLAEVLADDLGADRVRLGAPVVRIEASAGGYRVETAAGEISARRVALALPPRVALETIRGLDRLVGAEAASIPTWMAGQAKAAAIYDAPSWREAGLSGEAISHRGPLGQIHDASPPDACEGALVGFLAARPENLEDAIAAQLARLFGDAAAAPRRILVEDWAAAPETTSARDAATPGQPLPHMAARLTGASGLVWAGSEAALESTGLLEGALAAAERAAETCLAP